MSSFSINPFNFFISPIEFIREMYNILPKHFNSILSSGGINHFIFSNIPRGNIVNPVNPTLSITIANLIITFVFCFTLLFSVYIFILNVINFKKISFENRSILITILCIFTIIILNRTTNNYDLSFWLKTLGIMSIFFIAFNYDNFKKLFRFPALYISILNFALLSSFILCNLIIYEKYVKNYVNADHWYTINTPLSFYSPSKKESVYNFFKTSCCSEKSEILLFDDHTYSIFYSKIESYPLTYAALPFFFNGKVDKKGFLNWSQKNKIRVYSSCDFNYLLEPALFKLEAKDKKNNLCIFKNF
jgi:hypothetical protein